MPLARIPTPCTLKDIYQAEGRPPAKAQGFTTGTTSPPTRFSAPAFVISERRTEEAHGAHLRQRLLAKVNVLPPGKPPGGPSAESYTSNVTITVRADEGSNISLYLKEGIYETNHAFDLKSFGKMQEDEDMKAIAGNAANFLLPWEKGKARVYFVMPQDVADLNRQAETEHCNDFLLAYQLTLGALSAALEQAAATPVGPAGSAQLAKAARLDQLRHLLPPKLKDVAQNFALCEKKYIELCELSLERDGKNWHSWGMEYLGSEQPTGTVHYLTGSQRDEQGRVFLRYTKGPSQIGVHHSSSLIHL